MKTDILSGRYFNYFCFLLIVLIPIYLLYNYFSYAFTVNSYNGFPLDDPWIHLTFGKNLKEYFSFSYYKNENATAGSTSPLYTFIVAAGFFFTDNEMILSYVLGGLFFVFACIYFFKLTRIDLGDKLILCLLCTLIFILDYNMNFTALSGMETSLFIFELLLGAYFYKAGKAIPLGITLGLIMWTRPDGVAFIAAVIIDYLYNRYFVKSDERLKHFTAKQTVYILLISGGITSAYFIMNYVLSGTFFPNTYSAKIAYFADSGKRLYFLKDFIWELYTVKHYSILMFGFVFSLLKFLYDLIKRKSNPNSLYILFIFAFLIMYVIKLPTVNKYGRYQIPLVPFFILVSLIGFKDFFSLILFFLKNSLAANLLTGISFVILIFISIDSYETYKIKFATQCKYTHNRQVAVANWINKNTNDNDIIATHDVGAIGFYTNRRIVDVAGLVTPELTKSINEDNYFEIVSDYLKKNGVTYTAFFREWFHIKNQNPVYRTPVNESDNVFEIYKFDPVKSGILSTKAYRLILESIKSLLKQKDGNLLVNNMNEALAIDPDCALAYLVRAQGYSYLNNQAEVENNLKKAIVIQPDFKDALLQLGRMKLGTENYDEAKEYFLKVIEVEPGNREASDGLKMIEQNSKILK